VFQFNITISSNSKSSDWRSERRRKQRRKHERWNASSKLQMSIHQKILSTSQHFVHIGRSCGGYYSYHKALSDATILVCRNLLGRRYFSCGRYYMEKIFNGKKLEGVGKCWLYFRFIYFFVQDVGKRSFYWKRKYTPYLFLFPYITIEILVSSIQYRQVDHSGIS